MATKSLLKNIDIKNKQMGKEFSDALKKADDTPHKAVEMRRPHKFLKGDDVREFFKGNS